MYPKGPLYLGIKVYNNLPPEIKELSHNIKKCKSFLKRFLNHDSFYSLEEYFNYKEIT
jgi:polyphosphate kinase